MRRKVIAILLSVIVSIGIVFGVAYGTRTPAEATPQLDVCPPVCVTVTLPPITLPGVTITRLVTLPPATVRVPPVTVTEIVRPPRVTQTIIQPPVTLPGPVRTVTQTIPQAGLPGATTTATVVVSREVISNGTAPPVTREVRSTLPSGQTTVTPATVTPSKEVVRIPGTTKVVTRNQAIGLSLLGLLALMGLGWLLLWLGFALGYKSADKENTNFLRALRDTVRRRPGKHE